MKKLLLILLCIAVVFSFAACGTDENEMESEITTEEPSDEIPTDDIDESGEIFTFEAETIDGESLTSEDLKDAKLIMVNLWEPWCGPCVEEMPDLQKIYMEHKDEGFVILGVYSTLNQTEDAKTIIEEEHITYPILKMNDDFSIFTTDYVPTTVFLTGEGKALLKEPVIGGQTYDTWNTAVESFLEELKDD